MVDASRVSVLLQRIRDEVAALRQTAARTNEVVELLRTRLDDVDAHVDAIASRLTG